MELNRDVIRVIGEHWKNRFGDRLEIRRGDVLTYKPKKGERYTLAWFDIWPTICTDNLPEIAMLHKRWARRVEWYGSWRAEWLRDMREQERRQMEAMTRW